MKVLPLQAGHEPLPGADGYAAAIPGAWRQRAVRWWSFGGIVRSVQMPSGGPEGHKGEIIKTLAGWGGVGSFDEVLDHAQEVRELTGCRCVSGFSGAVRAAVPDSHFPRESATYTIPFLPLVRGAWQEALRVGTFKGHYRQYDLQSAYYSALLEGLPDPRTYSTSRVLSPDGVYRVKLSQTAEWAPYPFNAETEVLATGWEIDRYDLPVSEVVTGIRWRKDFNVNPIVEACDMWSFKKAARRCFWGHWASRASVKCHTRTNEWEPLRASPHPAWSHLILARVRYKVWAASHKAVHVFVDSVITPETLPVGTEAGTWKLVAEYPEGVAVGGTGRYASATSQQWDKFAGVPATDARRNRAA